MAPGRVPAASASPASLSWSLLHTPSTTVALLFGFSLVRIGELWPFVLLPPAGVFSMPSP